MSDHLNDESRSEAIARQNKIARLNDLCRSGVDRTSNIVITKNCYNQFGDGTMMGDFIAQTDILNAVRDYTFPEGDASLRDRGNLNHNGTTIYFAIDAYDRDLKYGSPDPANPGVTRRVMTIMLRSDM